MKRKLIAAGMIGLIITFFIGCASVQQVKKPVIKTSQPEKQGKLTYLYLTTDAEKMGGKSTTYLNMKVGETNVLYARGGDETGKWITLPDDLNINWKLGKEIKISPATGHTVTLKAVGPAGEVPFLEATATTKEGKKMEATIQVEIMRK